MCKSWLHIWKSIGNIYHICQNFISESKRQTTSHRTCSWWGMFCICVHLHVLHMCSFICPTYVSVYMSCLCLHLHVLHMSLSTSCSDERCCVLYVSPFTCSGGICCVLYLSPFTYPAYVSVYISCICLCSHVVMDGAVSCTCLCSHVVVEGAVSCMSLFTCSNERCWVPHMSSFTCSDGRLCESCWTKCGPSMPWYRPVRQEMPTGAIMAWPFC